MNEIETKEIQTAELTKAEQKKKDGELTPAELLAFGILPPEPDKVKPAHAPEPAVPDEATPATNGKDRDRARG